MPKDNATSDIATIGHNNPPAEIDPIDAAIEPYGDAIAEAENWLDGKKVDTEDQMKAVDAVLKEIRTYATELGKAEKEAVGPLHKAWQGEKARWKPTLDDAERMKKGLASLVSDFKVKLAEEKARAERAERAEAERKRREAEEAARHADAGDIEAQREAAQKIEDAKAAQKTASAAAKDKPKGLRTVTRYALDDHRAALHDIAQNDRAAMTAFIEDYVRRNHRDRTIAGVRVWTEKEAY
ncbi:hypothetical protein [Alloyangia pacifica]|uniref:hypothetical protein n=1 Tax=Alloyangia pacifica TaxID=311180 RepID=UPI0031D1F37B